MAMLKSEPSALGLNARKESVLAFSQGEVQ